MKYVLLGSNSDICKEFIKTLNDDDEIITLSRSNPCDIKLDWESDFKLFTNEDFIKLRDYIVMSCFVLCIHYGHFFTLIAQSRAGGCL